MVWLHYRTSLVCDDACVCRPLQVSYEVMIDQHSYKTHQLHNSLIHRMGVFGYLFDIQLKINQIYSILVIDKPLKARK